MREKSIPSPLRTGTQVIPDSISGMHSALARKMLFARLKELTRGQLILKEGETSSVFGDREDSEQLRAILFVHDQRFYANVVFGGSIGAGEAYMSRFWTTDDLPQLIRIIIMNRHVLTKLESGTARMSEPLHRIFHRFRKNTKGGSKKNIAAHYDLGNDFYSLFLDDTMTYSCGIFSSPASSLRDASIEKYARICRKLLLRPDDRVLEIGGGWGGFAIYAARTYGCRVTTTTISGEQFEFAQQRIHEEGLGHRIELLLRDYRDLQGSYDKLVSIEMVEAVGHQYLGTFFRCCSDRLKKTGVMLLQAITIADEEYDRHKHSVDFIKRYIFPGSCIPSVRAISEAVAGETDMVLSHCEEITPHYARTLREWRKRFFSRISDVREQGYPEEFIRRWEYYLSYCEAGFAERYIRDVQLLFTKPLAQKPPEGGDPRCSAIS